MSRKINERPNEEGLKGLNSSRSSCRMAWILYDERNVFISLEGAVILRKTKSEKQKSNKTEGQMSASLFVNTGYR